VTSRPVGEIAMVQALAYARHGWPVFPCRPGRKEPDTAHGFKDATTDPDHITAWWAAVPSRNVAIATGAPGPDVLDVDVRPDGNGHPALNRLRQARLLEGSVAIVATPNGGLHLYYGGTDQASGRLPGCYLDFKATGGYVLAPPSMVGGRPYRVIMHQLEHPDRVPQGRLDWAAAVALLEPRQSYPPAVRSPGQADATRLAGWVAGLPEGNRNAGLFWAACRAVEAEQLGALGALASAAYAAGLPEQEIVRTIASARRSAGRERSVPLRQRHHAEPLAEHDSEAVT